MKTQVKTIFVQDPERIESEINIWLAKQDIDIHQIMMFPLAKGNTPVMMILLIYSKDDWKG